ncbi:S24 family peptidase [Microvirga pudoricolor]|uniref:S24 family peptidase n=1 Tax=Microvirga pudoricolor TaxID=2778729 RepID=UPI0019522619|nr:helix-turn-helix transcriptional regulator [Microvirga pudoricolor]MBM6592938.1 helix-turn-helix transcriptional regulator [Microvirga pudoricolor]
MLSHDRVWAAIDALASRYGMTASGLARKAGLDATSFNKSKRTSPEGRDRWPSTESISKILQATGASLEDFLRLVDPASASGAPSIPMTSTERAGNVTLPQPGQPPAGPDWQTFSFPNLGSEQAFALEVRGGDLAPLYRDGNVLIVSPAASPGRGDRVVIRRTGGGLLAGEFVRRSAESVDVTASPGADEQAVPAGDIAWIARVMWARL